MKNKITFLILFVALLLLLIPTNTFAQTFNSDLPGPMFNPPPFGLPPIVWFGIISVSTIGQVFGLISYGFYYKSDDYSGFDLTINIPIGITLDYAGKEPARVYIFTPIMAGKYAKFYPRIEFISSFSLTSIFSFFPRFIFPINIKENFFSIQPFIGIGLSIASLGFLFDSGIFFQISIVTLGINYQMGIRESNFILHKFLFKFSIYF